MPKPSAAVVSAGKIGTVKPKLNQQVREFEEEKVYRGERDLGGPIDYGNTHFRNRSQRWHRLGLPNTLKATYGLFTVFCQDLGWDGMVSIGNARMVLYSFANE